MLDRDPGGIGGRRGDGRAVNDVEAVLWAATHAASRALDKTPSLLAVLREAGVVDSGGAGLLRLFEGALAYVRGEVGAPAPVRAPRIPSGTPTEYVHVEAGHGYETVYLVHPFPGQLLDLDRIRAYLVRTGESVNVAGDPKAAKIHVHNGRPDLVLRQALQLGRVVNATVVDLDHQTAEVRGARETGPWAVPVAPSVPAPGTAAPGQAQAPRASLWGSSRSPRGTAWPRRWRPSASPTSGSTSRSCAAARRRTPAPARSSRRSPPRRATRSSCFPTTRTSSWPPARQRRWPTGPVRVVPTRNAAEGIAALLEMDPGAGASGNAEPMLEAGRAIQTLLVTEAVRDALVSAAEGQARPDDGPRSRRRPARRGRRSRAGRSSPGIAALRAGVQPGHPLVRRRGRTWTRPSAWRAWSRTPGRRSSRSRSATAASRTTASSSARSRGAGGGDRRRRSQRQADPAARPARPVRPTPLRTRAASRRAATLGAARRADRPADGPRPAPLAAAPLRRPADGPRPAPAPGPARRRGREHACPRRRACRVGRTARRAASASPRPASPTPPAPPRRSGTAASTSSAGSREGDELHLLREAQEARLHVDPRQPGLPGARTATSSTSGRIVPVYPLTAGLAAQDRCGRRSGRRSTASRPTRVPARRRSAGRGLPAIAEALEQAHFPDDFDAPGRRAAAHRLRRAARAAGRHGPAARASERSRRRSRSRWTRRPRRGDPGRVRRRPVGRARARASRSPTTSTARDGPRSASTSAGRTRCCA